jgi:hypothetical protein
LVDLDGLGLAFSISLMLAWFMLQT